jgi:uncharacterized protein YjbJ (UPF0337 family)
MKWPLGEASVVLAQGLLMMGACGKLTVNGGLTGRVSKLIQEVDLMSGKTDEMKGRVKEAAGALTDDEKLKREGKLDQAAGKTKQAVEKAIDKARDAMTRD